MKKNICSMLILVLCLTPAYMQDQANYDESKVPSFTLPELLTSRDGKKISTAKEWTEIRRPEILSLFEESMYGMEEGNDALGGKAVRKQILLTFRNAGKELNVNLLIYLPKNVGKAPVFLGYNFDGNHTVTDDPAIILPSSWIKNDPGLTKLESQVLGTTRIGIVRDLFLFSSYTGLAYSDAAKLTQEDIVFENGSVFDIPVAKIRNGINTVTKKVSYY